MALKGCTIGIFCDFSFEDLEVTYPRIRLAEEGARVIVIGCHPAGTKYTGKYGYPVKSDICVDDMRADGLELDALVLPGGFAPDYMRRNQRMLGIVAAMVAAAKPVAAICHGPWMLCSARDAQGVPVAKGLRLTSFCAIKDDLINAGGEWVDEPVVVDRGVITSRTPDDMTPFCQAIISAVASTLSAPAGSDGGK